MSTIIRYQSLRNDSIGILVEERENDIILDFDGHQKPITTSNLRRWYKRIEDGVAPEETQSSTPTPQKVKAQVKAPIETADNGDTQEVPKCGDKVDMWVAYAQRKNCTIKETSSYIRIRFDRKNIMEIKMPKNQSRAKAMVRHEAILELDVVKEGRQVPKDWCYSLDHEFIFNHKTDNKTVYTIIDALIAFETERSKQQIATKKKVTV